MPTLAIGRIVGPDNTPVTRRSILLQGFGPRGWTTLEEIDGGEFEIELPDSVPTPRTTVPVALRLLDQSTQTPHVISSDPIWVSERDLLLADFGQLRLLEEPYHRKGLKAEGHSVIGAPQEQPTAGGGDDDGDNDESGPVIRDLRRELAASQTALGGVRRELIDSQATLDGVRRELSESLATVDRLTTTLGTPTKVVDLISGLGTQLSITNTELARQTTPFRLAEVKLDLRGRLGDDGQTIVMDGSGDGSGLSAELVVDAATSAVPTQGVPSVLGLTASAASRVLRSVGFRMESATQQLSAGQGIPGQAVTQHPAHGGTAEFGTAVLVVFGVRSESDE